MEQSDPRPRSAVSGAVGVVGLVGLLGWVAVALHLHLDGPYAAMLAVAACGLPMIMWSLIAERVHRNPTTGLDWSRPLRPWRETIDVSLAKLVGLWVTWGVIAILYCVGRWYWSGPYLLAMKVLAGAVPILLIASIPYMLWIDRRLADPRDGTFAFGQFLLGQDGVDREALYEHIRSWGVKGFFTAFMISIVPGNWAELIGWRTEAILSDPVAMARFLIAAMFLIDVAFATIGYLMTIRPLDAHIRSANPHAVGWVAALICYPPFILMNDGGPLDYHPGTEEWTYWLAGHPLLLSAVGAVLVGLTAIYAWATVAFGLRFSNLTHRGILTHGPYRWSRHPAYLSKNIFWWISATPFLVTNGSLSDMARNTIILGLVSGVYYWRARTEERHLGADPAYRIYSEWMERNAPIPRALRWLKGGVGAKAQPVAAEQVR